MLLAKGGGIVDIPSNHSVDQTVEKLRAILEAKGVSLFALVRNAALRTRPQKSFVGTAAHR